MAEKGYLNKADLTPLESVFVSGMYEVLEIITILQARENAQIEHHNENTTNSTNNR